MGNEEPLDPTEPLDSLGSKNDMRIDEKEEPLKPSLSIIGLGQNDEELVLIVVVPSKISSVKEGDNIESFQRF
jgi:hypothetical protein